MSDTATPILSVNNIEVIYDHVILVLKGVSLAVPEGGIVALLGANGAGKTTTLKAVSNLLRAERGDVTKGLDSGFFRYLTKPIIVADLMSTLELAFAFAATRSPQTPRGTA